MSSATLQINVIPITDAHNPRPRITADDRLPGSKSNAP